MLSTAQWVAGVFAIFVSALVASSAGTGGGALYMPVFMHLFNDAHKAVPLSKTSILGVAIAAFLSNFNRRHPTSKEGSHLINFAIAALLEPLTLLGSSIGLVLSLVIPSLVVIILLGVCLCITARTTIRKGIGLYKIEKREHYVESERQRLFERIGVCRPNSTELVSCHSGSNFVVSGQNLPGDGICTSAAQKCSCWAEKFGSCMCKVFTKAKPNNLSASQSLQTSTREESQIDDLPECQLLLSQSEQLSQKDQSSNVEIGGDEAAANLLSVNPCHDCFKRVSQSVTSSAWAVRGIQMAKKTSRGMDEQEEEREFCLDESQGVSAAVDGNNNQASAAGSFYSVVAVRLGSCCDYVQQRLSVEFTSIIYLLINSVVHLVGLGLSGGPASLVCGTSSQVTAAWLLILFHVCCTCIFIKYLISVKNRRGEEGLIEAATIDGGYAWISDWKTLGKYCAFGVLAGMCAGTLGIGGGLVKGPLMLEIGLNPLSAVTTATFMILFTSTATTLGFALAGQLDNIEGLIFAVTSFMGSLLGIWLINWIVKRYKFQSIVTLILGATILISIICMFLISLYNEFILKHFTFDLTAALNPLIKACQKFHH